jgi:hypothetical protein
MVEISANFLQLFNLLLTIEFLIFMSFRFMLCLVVSLVQNKIVIASYNYFVFVW